MPLRCLVHLGKLCLLAFCLASLCPALTTRGNTSELCLGQAVIPAPSPTPTPLTTQQPESIKVYTEEILLPVVATDANGRFDPSVEKDDLLVLEDGVPQTVQSIRRLPADVLLLLDTGGARNPFMRTNATRDLALRFVSLLASGDRVAVIQFGGRIDVIQSWTSERETAEHALKTKLFSGRRTLLVEALATAEAQFRTSPVGNRHVVLVTDGGALPLESSVLRESVVRLLATGATVHVLSYTLLGRKAINKLHPKYPATVTTEKRKSAQDIADEIVHPNAPETLDTKLKRKIYVVVDTDFRMWRHSRDYAKVLKKNEQWLAWLAEESGGRMILPRAIDEFAAEAEQLAREIDSQYLVTYRPNQKSSAEREPVRRIEVFPRRIGLQVRSRRSYVERQ